MVFECDDESHAFLNNINENQNTFVKLVIAFLHFYEMDYCLSFANIQEVEKYVPIMDTFELETVDRNLTVLVGKLGEFLCT